MGHRARILWLAAVLLGGIAGAPGAGAVVEVGEEAPDFTLPATTGGKITLSQFRGKKHVLLEFYGVDFEPV
jgi:AhpC/TSA family